MTQPWNWYRCPKCGRSAYVPGGFCGFDNMEKLIPMATDKSAAPMRRASEFDTFGKNLDSLMGRDVILRRFSVSERPITDRETKERGDKVFVNVWINETANPDAEPSVYHAWSEPLANKLAQIPDDALPVLIKFLKVPGAQGNVLTFE